MLEPKGRLAKLTAPRAKPVALYSQGIWGTDQLKTTKNLSGIRVLFLLYPGQETNS